MFLRFTRKLLLTFPFSSDKGNTVQKNSELQPISRGMTETWPVSTFPMVYLN